MMLTISNIDSNNISVNEYGGKAHGLSILLENELPVPKTIAIVRKDYILLQSGLLVP